MNNCKNGERIDDLKRNNLKIIQNPGRFCFGMDAVLLSGFAEAGKNDRVIDLGCGNGIIPILMSAKTEGKSFTGLEIQDEMADMADRSVKLNGISDRVKIVRGDIRNAIKEINGQPQLFQKASFNVVTSNPPYMAEGSALINPSEPLNIARHEIMVTLDEVMEAAAGLLVPGGKFYLVHRPSRLAEIFAAMGRYRLEPKRMKMVHPFIGKDANMVLICAVKGAGHELKVEKPIIVYESINKYTQEIYDIYGY